MLTFLFFKSSIISKRVSISAPLMPVVGSSSRSIFAFMERAFIISIIRFWPIPSSETIVLGSMLIPKVFKYPVAFSTSSLRRTVPRTFPEGSWPRKMFSATDRVSIRLSSWYIAAFPFSLASTGFSTVVFLPYMNISPLSI